VDTQTKQPLIPVPVVLGVVSLLFLCVSIGAVFYHYVEDLSIVDAIYFSAITVTTVGFGDFVPKTDIGKIFTAIYAFMGIGLFFGSAAIIFQTILGRMNQLHESVKILHKDHKDN